jgi:hypothetical protein
MPRFANPRTIFLLVVTLLLGHTQAFIAAQAPPQRTSPPTSQSPSGFRIAGTVVNATTSQPLARAQVSIMNTKNPNDFQMMVTSDDGRFQFQANAGKYSLQAARRGFITSAYDQHENFWTGIVTGGGLDTESLVLRLPPAAVLTGSVTDDTGEPVRNAAVMVFREDHRTGVSRIQEFSRASTDDLGVYEVTPLDAGTYFLAVSAQPWYAVHPASSEAGAGSSGVDRTGVDRTLDVAFPITYYKDATGPDDATPIPLRRGDHTEVDVQVNPVAALNVVFHAAPDFARGFPRPVLVQPVFDGITVPQDIRVDQVSLGVYEMTGIAPGKYTLQAHGSPDGRPTAASDIYLNNDGQELDLSAGVPTASIKAVVRLHGMEKLPAQINLALRNDKGRVVTGTSTNDKGEAEFTNVAPGKYDVLARSPAKAYSVIRIVSDGLVSSGHALNVPAGSSLTVFLSLVGGAVTVEGFAKRSGKPAPGAMVVLVPKDPESNLELFRRDQSDLDGSFVLRGVVPGTYTILAIEDGWNLDWAKPAVIEHYRQHGQKLVVGDQPKGPLHMPEPVEVQPKL